MAERLNRVTPVDLEIRSDGRTIAGIAAPFDAPAEIRMASGAFTEVFRPGAFARTIAERGDRVKLFVQHDHLRGAVPIGRATLLREDPVGLYAELRVSKTDAGDQALELVRDGALDGLSIGFEPMAGGDRWSRSRDLVERHEVKLLEISAVAFPAYDGARVLAVRQDEPRIHAGDAYEALNRLCVPVSSTDAAERLARLLT